MITKVINVNLHQPIYERLTAKQGDIASRYLLFHLLDGDKPFDLSNRTVRVYAIKPDKTEIFNDLTINDASKGYCTLELTSQCLASAGVVKMELYISESGKVLTSIPFELEVIACINTANGVTSTNEFSALEVALGSLQDYDNLRREIIQARKGHATVGKRLDNFDSQLDTKANLSDVAKISSGTPLFASSTSEMTDTTKNYVNTTDGYLYSYIEGAWTKTTVLYQSKGIDNDSINVANLKSEVVDNLASYDKFNFTIQNGYYNNQTGDFVSNSAWKSTKINVVEGQKYDLSATVNGALTSLCLYFDNGNNIIGKDHTGIAFTDTTIYNAEIIIPKNCTSMAITWATDFSYDFKKCNINNTNEIKNDINKLNEDIKIDFLPSTNDLIYDNTKAEFTITNGILKATLLTSQNYIPCFFNKTANAIEYTHINQDTIIVVGKKDGKFITYAVGDKDGTKQVTGDMYEFTESDSSFVKIKSSSVSAPTKNTIVKLTYENDILKVYYNNVLNDTVSLPNSTTTVPFNMFGVVKSNVNDNLNNGLVKNLTILNSVKIKEEVNRINDVISNLSFLNNYKDKKANFLGDSITQGVATTKIYHQYIQENLDLSVARNYGIGGTCITNIEANNFISRYSNMDDDADLICVFGGTNDFGHHMPLGDINSTDDKTFYGALKVLCEGLINKYMGKTIIFITPLNRSCDKFPADGCSQGRKINNLGFKLEDYVKAINDVVPSYSIPVFDLFKNSNLYPYNPNIITTYMPDGLHPNANGHYIIGRKISEFIKNQ